LSFWLWLFCLLLLLAEEAEDPCDYVWHQNKSRNSLSRCQLISVLPLVIMPLPDYLHRFLLFTLWKSPHLIQAIIPFSTLLLLCHITSYIHKSEH
jgi:hypothetical protein